MSLRTGVDLTSVSRIRSVLKEFPERFPSKYFPELDLSEFVPSEETYAGIWSVKEATFKVIGRGYRWSGIQVDYEPTGRPILQVDYVEARLDETPIPRQADWDCSIAHDAGLAIGFVVCKW